MGIDVEYHYPTEVSPTASWVPGCAKVDGYAQDDDDGVTSGLASGGHQWSYQIADPTIIYHHKFRVPYTKIVQFRTFRDTVLGRSFKMYDPIINTYVIVRFDPSAFKRVWALTDEWDDNEERLFEVEIVLRQQVA